jgi:hypothetical protein
MVNHHYEQEMRRLKTVVDSVALINPHQVKHILKLHPEFKFKDRDIYVPPDPEAKQSPSIQTTNNQTLPSSSSTVETKANTNAENQENENKVDTKVENNKESTESNNKENNTPSPAKKKIVVKKGRKDKEAVAESSTSESNTTMSSVVVPSIPTISKEDSLLLDRVKWLLNRYRDATKYNAYLEHIQPSIDLLIQKNEGLVSAEMVQELGIF